MTAKHDDSHLDHLLSDALATEASRSAARARQSAERAWAGAAARLQVSPVEATTSPGQLPVPRAWWRRAAPALAGVTALALVAFFGLHSAWFGGLDGAPQAGVSGTAQAGIAGNGRINAPVQYGPAAGPGAGADVSYYPPHIVLAEPRTPGASSQPTASRPAPVFRNTFRPTADPFPPKVGQSITFVSQPGWDGRRVWLYAAPAREQETVMYDRQLPKDAILIGTVDIDQTDGHWTLANWTIPHQLSHGEYTLSFAGPDTWFNLVAVTDTGYLAGSGLPIGLDRTLEASPADVTAGQVLTIRGAGYPANERIRLDVMHDRPESQGGTDLEVTIGWVRTDADGRFAFDYRVPAEFNWAFADNMGQMQDHRVTAGAPGTFSILAVEYEAGADHGYATLEKQVGIQAAQ